MWPQAFREFLTVAFEKFKAGDSMAAQPFIYLSNNSQRPVIAWFRSTRNKCIALCLVPLLWLFVDMAFGNLGSNPIQALHIRLGDWSLRFLCLTLLITPLQKITRLSGLTRYRQLLGLYAFFYATLHLLGYLAVDHAFVWSVIWTDIVESSYIWFGLFSYIMLFLLAITSPDAAKRLMGKAWKKLHRWIYPASVAVLFHYFWQLKGDLAEPLFYAAIIFILLAFRVALWLIKRKLHHLPASNPKHVEDD